MHAHGYHGECRVLDAKGWVPQRRQRAYMIFYHDKVGHAAQNPGLAFELVEKMTVPVPALESFLETGCENVPAQRRGRPAAKDTKPKRWQQQTRAFILKHKLQPKLLINCASFLGRSPDFADLTPRERKLLATRYAFLLHVKKRLV